MARYTVTTLRENIDNANRQLQESGSRIRFEAGARNNYQAVDQYSVDANCDRIGSGVDRNICCGTSRECGDAMHTQLANELRRMSELPTTTAILSYVGSADNSDGQKTVTYSQHMDAVLGRKQNDFSRALIMMLQGWESYAKAHADRYEDPIGNDYVLGPYWANVGFAINRLLDGDTGGLDCGSINHNILSAIDAQGFEHDGCSLIGGQDDE